MELNRRDFLKGSLSASGIFLLGKTGLGNLTNLKVDSRVPGGKAVLYDASKCIGCRICEASCKKANQLNDETTKGAADDLSGEKWTIIKKVEYDENGKKEVLLRKRQCMHCTDASCEAVCATGAISHQGTSVIIDQDWCVGCGYCVQACPFGVPHKDESTGTARKCILCAGRTAQGLNPACVETCPVKAVIYGDREELIAEGKRRVQNLIANGKPNANFYGDNSLGGTGVMYVLLEKPPVYNMPQAPQVATNNMATRWLGGLLTAGVISIAPFWMLFKRAEERKQAQEVAPATNPAPTLGISPEKETPGK